MTALRSLRVAAFLSRRAITRGNRGIVILTIAMMAIIYAELMFVRLSSKARPTRFNRNSENT